MLWTLALKENPWARLLAYVTGLINQELLLKNEYLAAENRVLRVHLPARLRLSDPETSTVECLSKLILFGEASLRRALTDFVDHFRARETTKRKVTSSCSRRKKLASKKPEAQYVVGSASAGY